MSSGVSFFLIWVILTFDRLTYLQLDFGVAPDALPGVGVLESDTRLMLGGLGIGLFRRESGSFGIRTLD